LRAHHNEIDSLYLSVESLTPIYRALKDLGFSHRAKAGRNMISHDSAGLRDIDYARFRRHDRHKQ